MIKLSKVQYQPKNDVDVLPVETAETIPFCGVGIVRIGKSRSYKIVHFGTGYKMCDANSKPEAVFLLERIAKMANWLEVTRENVGEKAPGVPSKIIELQIEFRAGGGQS